MAEEETKPACPPARTGQLSILAYADGFTLWFYRSEHSVFEWGSQHFADVIEQFRLGDRIIINAPDAHGDLTVIKGPEDTKVVVPLLRLSRIVSAPAPAPQPTNEGGHA